MDICGNRGNCQDKKPQLCYEIAAIETTSYIEPLNLNELFQ